MFKLSRDAIVIFDTQWALAALGYSIPAYYFKYNRVTWHLSSIMLQKSDKYMLYPISGDIFIE